MNALAKAVIAGTIAGVGYALVRGITTAAASEADRASSSRGNNPVRPDMAAEPDQPGQPSPSPAEPGSSPSAPGGAPQGKSNGKRRAHVPITSSTHDKATGHVHQSPGALLDQARRTIPDLTLTEYTAGRMIASEHYRGTPTEWAAILDSELNRAPADLGRLTAHIAPLGMYGYQGKGKRKVATTRDPAQAHIETARRVLRGELRGIAKGAVQFFDPRSQAAAHQRWRTGKSNRQHCPPAVILQRWSFGHPWADKAACTLNTAKTGGMLEWVGPIDGINPLQLMLFRRSGGGSGHQQQYAAALALLRGAGLA